MRERRRATSTKSRNGQEHQTGRLALEKAYMRFQCVRCSHCVSPGMFTPEGWVVYKQTGRCPDCQ